MTSPHAALIERLKLKLLEIENHCPCGARPESPKTHPHVGMCPVFDALELVNALIEAPAITVARCLDCGLPYAEFPLDMTLSDEQWSMIHPDVNGLLCAGCIVKRAEKLPGRIAVRARIEFVGDAVLNPKEHLEQELRTQIRELRARLDVQRSAALAALADAPVPPATLEAPFVMDEHEDIPIGPGSGYDDEPERVAVPPATVGETDIREQVESREFYELMQAYRHAPMSRQTEVLERFAAVQAFVQSLHRPPDAPGDVTR